jgi:hypothetical protein
MKQMLSGLAIEIVSLKDIGLHLDVDESGN